MGRALPGMHEDPGPSASMKKSGIKLFIAALSLVDKTLFIHTMKHSNKKCMAS